MHAAAGLRASRPWGESRHEGIVKSDKLEIGRILHLKLEIKKSQIGLQRKSNLKSLISNLRCRIRPISSLSDFIISRLP